MINGRVVVKVPQGNYTLGDNNRTYPKWEYNNTLRICMQVWDAANPDYVEQVRWVLNYTFPTRDANFTMQHAYVNNTPPAAEEEEVDWREQMQMDFDPAASEDPVPVDEGNVTAPANDTVVLLPPIVDPMTWCSRAENWTGMVPNATNGTLIGFFAPAPIEEEEEP